MEGEKGKRTQLFLGFRKGNGQIGYLSESLSIPEFFEMVQPLDHQGRVLVDFSPVIETLHALHKKNGDEAVISKYKSMYSYWHDSISYSDTQIRLPKCESLTKAANELLVTLEERIAKHSTSYTSRRTEQSSKNLSIILELEKEVNIAIDTLLCFIHSKASLEIASFKKDRILGEYCTRLLALLEGLLVKVLDYSTYNNSFNLESDSLLYYLAFVDNSVTDSYSQLLPNFENKEDLRLVVLRSSSDQRTIDVYNDRYMEVATRYRIPDQNELRMAQVLRDLCYKVRSVNELINILKHEVVQWDPSENSVEELKALIHLESPDSSPLVALSGR
ncbi:hypothetical protein K1T36_19590 [Pseudomonas protegens]|uniref:hypothetical protein n=1 Tax=Pseudomonas protegens TaxID=380021 RepID=UPI001C69DB3F|nr:hypothetical protein [Pseudomonas protegens]QYM99282.1 hypothetical protein K1T36_19590 [Pseudomonas protegens]